MIASSPPRPVAGGARHRADAAGPYGELLTIETADRAAAGGDRFDRQEGRGDAYSGLHRLALHLEAAVPAAHIGAGSSHVKGYGASAARLLGDMGGTDDATGRPTED